MTKKITEADFYLDRPKMLGIRGWSLLLPAILAAVGFCAFAILAFSFTELESLPAAFRRGLVIVGSFTLAIGGELGTLSATVEIFRKRKQAETWDWLSLAISALATMAAFILSFAALLGVNATWSEFVKLYGPLALGVLAAFDAYSCFAEVGMYLSTYDDRMSEWQAAFDAFRRESLAPVTPATVTPQPAQVSNTVEIDAEPVNAVSTLDKARSVKADNDLTTKQARIDKMLSIYRDDPFTSPSTIAEAVGVSRQTVYKYLSELEETGAVHNNGEGVKVL
jgi:hypothetical protein